MMVAKYGHFAVMSPKMSKWNSHQRILALVEINGDEAPTKLDPRQKALKRIILRETLSTSGLNGSKRFQRHWADYCNKAGRWNTLYPMHVLAKDWPLRSTVEGTY